MHFHEWYRSLKEFLLNEEESLTAKVSNKLSEIVQFFGQFSSFEKIQIDFVSKEMA